MKIIFYKDSLRDNIMVAKIIGELPKTYKVRSLNDEWKYRIYNKVILKENAHKIFELLDDEKYPMENRNKLERILELYEVYLILEKEYNDKFESIKKDKKNSINSYIELLKKEDL